MAGKRKKIDIFLAHLPLIAAIWILFLTWVIRHG